MKAIAAMSLNRVIGRDGEIPWHISEDFQWFKKTTLGHVVLMGRKTYESLGQPLPKRTNVILTRGNRDAFPPETIVVSDLAKLEEIAKIQFSTQEIFVIGGAEVYAQLLPKCTDLFLSVVKREVEGDAFFPTFEDDFDLVEIALDHPEFEVRHYRNRRLNNLASH